LALFLEPSGKETTLTDVHKLWYDGIRDMFQGPAEIVELENGSALIVHEEFLLRGFPVNKRATSLFQDSLAKKREFISPHLAPELSADRKILGPAILLEPGELQKIKNAHLEEE